MDEARLRWLCRRGMKELDVLLERFLANSYPGLDESQRRIFHELVEMEDPDLYALLMGKTGDPDPKVTAVVNRIRSGS